MKIITTTIQDFFNAEVEEWGFDYVEAQFLMGYEPTLVNGVWCWRLKNETLQPISSVSSTNTLNHRRGGVRLLTVQ